MRYNGHRRIGKQRGKQGADFFRVIMNRIRRCPVLFYAVGGYRHIVRLFGLQRQRNANRPRIPRVKGIGFKIKREEFLFARFGKNNFQFRKIKYNFINADPEQGFIGRIG